MKLFQPKCVDIVVVLEGNLTLSFSRMIACCLVYHNFTYKLVKPFFDKLLDVVEHDGFGVPILDSNLNPLNMKLMFTAFSQLHKFLKNGSSAM